MTVNTSATRGDRYRAIAAEVRAASRTITFEETRATMLRLADAYDQAADRIEERGVPPAALGEIATLAIAAAPLYKKA
ncbi:MAG TPA: hypothetical protein VL966_17360 [Alphaproteobacteria bacterium]|jgi:hypothetical protein|nr:hypothetical protein [Alphaproteobacteria bacterium]